MKRTLFITGGASGIGRAVVEKFLRKGFCVGVLDIDDTKLQDLHSHLCSLNLEKAALLTHAGDVSQGSAVQDAIVDTQKRFGGIDVLCANAGVHAIASLAETEEAAFDRIMAVNLKGTFLTLKHGLPYLKKAIHPSIILMGSDQSLCARSDTFSYGVTKGAIAQMAKSLALELGPDGIRVNAVCPGTIETPLAQRALEVVANRFYKGDLAACLESEKKRYPLGRLGQAEEVANAVYFLAQPESAYISGVLLPIDGAYLAKHAP